MQRRPISSTASCSALFLFLWALLGVSSLLGGIVDVTGETQVKLDTGRRMTFEFGIWNYAVHNPQASPLPTALSFQTYFSLPEGATLETISGSSLMVVSGVLFEVALESIDGALRVPLVDAHALRLGLPAGTLAGLAGRVCGAAGCLDPVGVLTGSVSLDSALAAALFGPKVWSDRGAALIAIVNHGPPVQIGLGAPYTLGQSFLIPGVSGEGSVITSGLPGKVTLYNPEPATLALLAAPLAWMLYRARRR